MRFPTSASRTGSTAEPHRPNGTTFSIVPRTFPFTSIALFFSRSGRFSTAASDATPTAGVVTIASIVDVSSHLPSFDARFIHPRDHATCTPIEAALTIAASGGRSIHFVTWAPAIVDARG